MLKTAKLVQKLVSGPVDMYDTVVGTFPEGDIPVVNDAIGKSTFGVENVYRHSGGRIAATFTMLGSRKDISEPIPWGLPPGERA